ncbi:MAG: hypothetical protein V7603_929 [Micromonosporaceae bacterium]
MNPTAKIKIFGPRSVAVQAGEVSVKQAAAQLGIPADAVYNWLRLGQVPARRGPSGRWCIPWDPATREVYRQKVAGSFRLNPFPPAQRTPTRLTLQARASRANRPPASTRA